LKQAVIADPGYGCRGGDGHGAGSGGNRSQIHQIRWVSGQTRDSHVPSCGHPGGQHQNGESNVPISEVVTLSGGFPALPDPTNAALVFNSQGGLTGNPLEVPGGLAGLTGLSEVILNIITFGANRVYAQAVLVGEPRMSLIDLSLTLLVRVNLRNPFLRSGCGIGSTATPIVLRLITGMTSPPAPARPISGHGPLRPERTQVMGTYCF
jgi:hypothetical protein